MKALVFITMVVALATTTLASVAINGVSAGPTPFVSLVQLTVSPPDSLKNIQFEITPKTGSVTRAISAVYYADYLQSRGNYDPSSGQITVPVFGLYQNFTNTVTLTSCFTDGTSQQDSLMVPTAQFSDPCGFQNPVILQARTNTTDLSFDYLYVKSNCAFYSPTILDTDGEIRWIGTAGIGSFSSAFYHGGFYISDFPTGSPNRTGLTRIELDDTFSFVGDYSGLGVTSTGHHNYDPGKRGLLVEVNTTNQTESVILEVDDSGNVLKTWDLGAILSAAMTAGGDDPSLFVKPAPTDWFHNNAATYRSSDDTLIVSSRENFVIALDYETGTIKWILGDPTKHWHQFPSLQQYALALGPSTLPPIGQHAVSITQDDDLLLFDDGANSLFQVPAGASRSYSAPRKYHIDFSSMTATEVWNYEAGQTLDSEFCSSVYEDAPMNYLVDYALIGRVMGLGASGDRVFDFYWPSGGCSSTWNTIPIHLEGLLFMGTVSHNPMAGWQITSLVCSGSDVAVSFPAVEGVSYRLEYKDTLTDAGWLTVSDYTASSTCAEAQIHDPSAVGQPQRFYRVRRLP